MKTSRTPGANRQRGWATSEYLAVLIGLMAIWSGSHTVLDLLQRSYADYSWALMIPY